MRVATNVLFLAVLLVLFTGGVTRAADPPTDVAGFEEPIWTEVTVFGRDHPSVTYDPVRRRLTMFGGVRYPGRSWLVPEGFRNDLAALALDGPPAWTRLQPSGAKPSLRDGAAGVYDPVRDRMLYFGGHWTRYIDTPAAEECRSYNDVWSLGLSGSPGWQQLSPSGQAPPVRKNAAIAYDPVRDQVIVLAGVAVDGNDQWFCHNGPPVPRNDAWALSLSGAPAWQQLPAPPAALQGDGVTAFYDPTGDRIVAVRPPQAFALALSGTPTWSTLGVSGQLPGGDGPSVHDASRGRVVFFNRTELWTLSLTTLAWARLVVPPSGPTPGPGVRMILDPVQDRLLTFGGGSVPHCNAELLAHVWALSLSSPAWSQLPTMPAPQLYPSTRFIYDPPRNRLVGWGAPTQPLNQTWALSLDGEARWNQIATSGSPPSTRGGQTAIHDAIRDRMIVFGGGPGQTAFDDAVYQLPLEDPVVWSVVAGGGPGPRMFHAAIRDPVGDRMIVFGGRDGTGANRNDTWQLSLANHAWTQIQPAGGPPPARFGCSAIYDSRRHRLVIYGGGGASGTLGDTWALDLGPNPAWSQLPSWTGNPQFAGVTIHSAAYDHIGDRMLVFGGDPDADRDRFYTLDFSSNQWQPYWTDIPSGRFLHTAVYDDARDRMLMLGGMAATLQCEGSAGSGDDVWQLAWDRPVPVAIALVESRVRGSVVSLKWFVGDGRASEARVYRRQASEWTLLASVRPDADGIVSHEDRTVRPGGAYEYRLGVAAEGGDRFSAPVRIEISTRVEFALHGWRPNPWTGEGDFAIDFSLPDAGPVDVVLHDLAGRRVLVRELGVREGGRQTASLGRHIDLAAGMYLVRLTQGERSVSGKVLIVD